MKKLVLLVVVVGFACLFTGAALGDIIQVPSQYPTIQAGINAASSEDTVQVAAGTYLENISMKSGVVIQGAGAGDDPLIHSIIDGGGTDSVVTASGVDSAAKLDGFTITNGDAPSGGGMYNYNSSPTVTNCTFSGNSAGHGGGIFNWSSSPTVANCTFSGNSVTLSGGGIYNLNSSSPTVTNCTFSANSAGSDGGGISNSNSSPTVTNCIFSANSAGYGGGMYNYNSSPTVTNCTFSGNSAALIGGGISNSDSSPTVTNCTFSANSTNNGGGISNSNSSPTVTNCTFSGNTAAHYGGGIYNLNSSSPTVTNCTFSGNSSAWGGGGMYNVTNSSPTLINCVLWGNSSQEIYTEADSSTSVTYSDIQAGYTGTGNINADPMFVDPDGPDNIVGTEDDDLHLKSGSPCIDTGTATGAPDTDIEGKPRPRGEGYDMGAYEFQGSAMPWIPLLLLDD